ncbi:DUF2058 family protein [Aquimonas voraii]|uniref:Uncharacterized conserved protein YaiL, DUF2058 family n=1 Tax=Aquimonas voraii TaxID=265719 RepID=A0A1G6XTC3_9GAMM|nr:DUF2058 family protein [Aquimonas voraii]SDD80963.1 Uncharacterized conserved protein YaiL, DUF2058 family [Aquimonas voraii]
MTTSLRDQLMQLGFKAPEPAKPREPQRSPRAGSPGQPSRGQGKPAPAKSAHGRSQAGGGQKAVPRSQEEIDLAKAYALRQRVEREEQQRLERERQAEAARRREARQKLFELMQKASLNAASAELPRHFEHAGKIRRVYVTSEQLKALNAGELAIVSAGGRYHLVTLAHADEARALMPDCVALQVDPNAVEGGDDYADPRFAVPDDLVW